MGRPNIVLTLADDQRFSALGRARGARAEAVRTPCLDALAERGLCWTHAYHAGSPSGAVCMPSRAMLHTGRGPFDLPADMMNRPESDPYCGSPGAVTLGQRLGEAGYRTHGIGKWHHDKASFTRGFDTGAAVFLGGMGDPFDLPTARWDGARFHDVKMPGCHSTDLLTESACAWLEEQAEEEGDPRPFFLYLALTAPHDPRTTHAQWRRGYREGQVTLPPNFLGEHPFDNGQLRTRDELLTPRPRDPGQTRREIADYYAMIEHMDHGLGRVHAALDKLGLMDNTLVIHSADHGLALGQHGLMGKQNLYDHSIRVPLVMAGPGIARGEARGALCYQHDLHPTILEAAGAGAGGDAGPKSSPFRSLWPAIESADASVHDYIGSYYMDTQRMVTDGRRKQIRYRVPVGQWTQNFDLEADPWERLTETGEPRAPADPSDREVCDQWFADWREATGDPWG